MNALAYKDVLLVCEPLRESTLRAMVRALRLPRGSSGLDAGCGIGLQCLLLAEAVGPAGHVTGLDVSAELLDCGRNMVREAGLSDRVSFQQGDVAKLPFDDHVFDWVWSADCVGYGPWEPLTLLKELARVVKPGGIVAIAAWSSEKLLPGYPRLEARLGATPAGIAPFVQGKRPGLHFLNALGWFHGLGLKNAKARVFADSVCAPLTDEKRKALEALLGLRWPDAAAGLSPEDAEDFRRLCQPDSPDYILDRPDYYAFFTYSMFWVKLPAETAALGRAR